MQLGSMLLCALVTLGTGFCASPAWAEDDDDAGEQGKSDEDKPDAGKSDEDKSEGESKAEGKTPEGPRFEIGITTTLASYSKLSFTLEIPTAIGDTPGDITNTCFGPSANPVTLELGYLLSSQLSLGLLIEAGSTSTRTTVRGPDPLDIDETQTLGRLMVGPRVSYLFSDTGAIRPFVMAAVGFTYAPQTASAGARSLALSGFEAIGGLGLHWFLTPSFSLDGALRGGYGLGSGHVEETYQIGTDPQNMNQPILQTSNVPVHGSLITGAVLIGASGWL